MTNVMTSTMLCYALNIICQALCYTQSKQTNKMLFTTLN